MEPAGFPKNNMGSLVIARLLELPATLKVLEDESLSQEFGMLARLRSEWDSRANRFDRDGEILLGAYRDERLVGIGGLNRDPYLPDGATGRIRHLYVLEGERRAGIGTALVERLLQHAVAHFDVVRLWSDHAHRFYESLGFLPVDAPKATHLLRIRN